MSPVTLSDASASIAAIVIEQYLEDRQREMQHFSRMSAVLGTDEPRPMDGRTRTAIELVLEEIRAGISTTHDQRIRETVEHHMTRDVLREVREPRTLEEIVDRDPLGGSQLQISQRLLALEERGLVRQLQDGHDRITWEITPAGEAQL